MSASGTTDAGCAFRNTAERGNRHTLGLSKGTVMLSTIAVILIVLWLLGTVTSYTLGGFVHVLLAIAIVVVLIRVIQGRNPVGN
jgi:hypothetical protein